MLTQTQPDVVLTAAKQDLRFLEMLKGLDKFCGERFNRHRNVPLVIKRKAMTIQVLPGDDNLVILKYVFTKKISLKCMKM